MATMTGCSSSNTPTGTDLNAAMVGTWLRTQQSTDGGATYTAQTDNYRISFATNGHWSDNQARVGTYVLNGNQCTLYILSNVSNRMTIAASSSNNVLTFVYYSDSAFKVSTGYVQIYDRV